MNSSVVSLGWSRKRRLPVRQFERLKVVVQVPACCVVDQGNAEDIRVDSLCFGVKSFEFAIKHFFLAHCLSYNVELPRLTILLELDLSTFSNRCAGICTNYYNHKSSVRQVK